ncbi:MULTISPECIES: hypothetical protein [unclassified Ruegeria]|uniref:hypothetical protein n=1 Tax=unclassified Ruegeria TaxID=2625375 RepID=UPI00148899CE|nr:hypothetical protein [Ruegeria sp. HKCCD8929]
MKPLMIALSLTLATMAAPVMALSVDMSNLTPTLTFPEPAPEPVSQDAVIISK